MSEHAINRRAFLNAAMGMGAIALAPPTLISAATEKPKGFRFVHLSDLHIQHELDADKGVIKALKAVEALNPKPDFIFTGGDLVMDSFDQGEPRAKMLFNLFKEVTGANTGLPMHHCIGNHDVFGWGQKEGVTPQNPLYGKKMICDTLGLDKPYHRFDHKGWRFYSLDTVQPAPDNGYQGYIDDEQMGWLESDLKAKDPATPAVVVTHIPIYTVTVFSDKSFKAEGGAGAYVVPNGGMCRDNRKLAELFAKHNVRLALSGHIHQLDRIELLGVTFVCDGAVSGNWWKGPLRGIEEGFGVIDVKPDGKFEHKYFDYGWDAKA